ncbi:cytochrome b5 domain-containing protein 1 isoform X3 [Struthio camelus]|uniref:cytochrome b5 domain-containing protein 1 isoform X3 n=1 Tax=Struthio camelus TaxID=8801 RepID=UPI003603E4BD
MAPPRPRYFTAREVAAHARPGDLWVSCLGRVLDLTPLAREHHGDPRLRPLLEAAGTDISHWFDPRTQDLLRRVDPHTGLPGYRAPGGGLLDVPPPAPRSDWVPPARPPWWRDPRYEVGRLGARPRRLRVLNTLTGQQDVLEVCAEETLHDILRRYLPRNAHAGSYSWRHGGAALDMERTLEQNGVADEGPELRRLGLDPERHLPALLLYFNDDFTEL